MEQQTRTVYELPRDRRGGAQFDVSVDAGLERRIAVAVTQTPAGGIDIVINKSGTFGRGDILRLARGVEVGMMYRPGDRPNFEMSLGCPVGQVGITIPLDGAAPRVVTDQVPVEVVGLKNDAPIKQGRVYPFGQPKRQ